MREIANNPDNRFDWWIMNKFNVLPTDPRFQDLTIEQKDYIWENYLIDNPEIEKKMKNHFQDPEFDEVWESMDSLDDHSEDKNGHSQPLKTKKGINTLDENLELIEKNYKEFLKSDNSENIDYKEVLKEKGITLDNENLDDVEDWEEVSDE